MNAMIKYAATLLLVLVTCQSARAISYPTYQPVCRGDFYRQKMSSSSSNQVGLAGSSIQRTARPTYSGYQSNISTPGSDMPMTSGLRFVGGSRRTPSEDGAEEGDMMEDGGQWWYWDGEGWILADNSHSPGNGWYWDSTTQTWRSAQDQRDPIPVPLGSIWMLLMMAVGYVCAKLIVQSPKMSS